MAGNGSATNTQIVRVFLSIDLAEGKDMLRTYVHGLICGNGTLLICEMVVIRLQGICQTIAPLHCFKLKTNFSKFNFVSL